MRRHAYRLLVAVTVTAVGMSIVLVGQASATERNREVVRRYFDLINSGEWRQAAELFAPDVQHHLGNWRTGTEVIVRGRTLLTDNMEDIYRTFPDWKMEVVQMVGEGESVVVPCRVSGTHQGVGARRINGGFLVDVQPTGQHFVVQHIHRFTVSQRSDCRARRKS